MFMRLVKLVILIPIAIVLIVLSVANRHAVTMALNPFRPEDQLLSVTLPFFVFMFLALICGMLIGSTATWFAQGKYRKRAREEALEARKWRDEASRQRDRLEELNTERMLTASK